MGRTTARTRGDGTRLAATYSRVSTPNDRREASLETQEAAQVALLESRGFVVPEEYRFRERFTGMESIYDRAVLGRLRDLVDSGRIEAMSAYDTDRLARDPRHLLIVVADNQKKGVETIFVKCDLETKGRIGEMILYMKGFASALQWDSILDCTTRGRQRIVDRGLWIGGGTVKFGYRWDKETRTRSRDPESAAVVERIFREIAAGASLQGLAAALNREGKPSPYAYAGRAGADPLWWPKTIHRLVKDRTYIGEARARLYEDAPPGKDGKTKQPNGRRRRRPRPESEHLILADGRTEALVSRELFDRANRVMAANGPRRGRPARLGHHLLTGVIYCAACGARMTPTSFRDPRRPGRQRKYRCFGHRLKEGVECGKVCGADWVEARTREEIDAKVIEPGWMEATVARLAKDDGAGRLRSDLASAEARRKDVARKQGDLIDLQVANADKRTAQEAFAQRLATLDAQAEDLDAHIEDLRGRIAEAGSLGETLRGFMAGIEAIRAKARSGDLTDVDYRDIIDTLGARVLAPFEGRRVKVELPLGSRRPRGEKIAARMYRTPRSGIAQDIIILESEAA